MDSTTLCKLSNVNVNSYSKYPLFISQSLKVSRNHGLSRLIHTNTSSLISRHSNNFNNKALSYTTPSTKKFSTCNTCHTAPAKYEKLFSPMNIGNVKIKNRVVQTSMGVGGCNPDGTVSDRTIEYYAERAKNGVGLIMTEFTRVNEKDGMSEVGQISLADDSYIPGVSKLAAAVHKYGSKIFIQLQHPGRQTTPIFPTYWPTLEKLGKVIPGFWSLYEKSIEKSNESNIISIMEKLSKIKGMSSPMLAPSKMPTPEEEPDIVGWDSDHRAMTLEEIHGIEQQFINAAIRAKKAGIDGVELHATHGYLLQQFLSPFTNRRTDEYGGSFENRCRIVKNIIEGIKKECGKDYPVAIRLTADEFHDMVGHPERGYHLDQGILFAKEFEKYGVDAIDVSCGCIDTSFLYIESNRYPLGWRQYFVKTIKDAVSVPVIGVGMIRTPTQAEELLRKGNQDFIGLARPLLADSQWVKKAYEDREKTISRCVGCLRCAESSGETLFSLKPLECSLNPRLLKEIDYPETSPKDGQNRKVVVVGAGPAGIFAGKELAMRGFQVTIFEKENEEGGQLNLADKPPCKERISWTTQDLRAQAEELGVAFRFGEEATVEKIKELSPEHVIIATGGVAAHPPIPGHKEDYVCTTTPILKGDIKPREKSVVVIGSGLTGLDTAEVLVHQKNNVTIVEMADKIAPQATFVSIRELIPELTKKGVHFMPGHKLEKITNHTVILSNKNGNKTTIPADLVVLAMGVKSDNALAKQLESSTTIPIHVIGDAKQPGRIVHAIQQAFTVARNIN